MQYRRLGRTELSVSAVAFGTCQLQVVPRQQGIATLLAGFELGVNLVHTAPDYGKAEEVVAEAVATSGREIIVASQGFDVPLRRTGRAALFEAQFEATCRRLRRDRLDLFGIACIDDREAYEENVWGLDGMVEFLGRMKAAGRLGGAFCTTHGSPEYIAKLVRSGVFDAIMLAWNPLGFHLLTSSPAAERPFEDIPRTGTEILPLCQDADVGVMVMKPLGGGLLCRSDALPPRHSGPAGTSATKAGDVLREILSDPRISCVVPGTASVTEASENARAGYATARPAAPVAALLASVRESVCSRCGVCAETCSQQLPVPEIIRSALVNLYPSARFELHKDTEYFEVLGGRSLGCASCAKVTCRCPVGLSVPQLMISQHADMLALEREGLIPQPPGEQVRRFGDLEFGASVLNWDLPARMASGATACCLIHLENAGSRGWFPKENPYSAEVYLAVFVDGVRIETIPLDGPVHSQCRKRFLFDVTAPAGGGAGFRVRLQLLAEHQSFAEEQGIVVFDGVVALGEDDSPGRSNAKSVFASPAILPAYGCVWETVTVPVCWPANEVGEFSILLTNVGSRSWRVRGETENPVDLAVFLNGELRSTMPLPRAVATGESVPFQFHLEAPGDNAVRRVRAVLLEQNLAWFDQYGVRPWVQQIPASTETALAEYAVDWADDNLPEHWPIGGALQVYLQIRNVGARTWWADAEGGAPVQLAVFVDGTLHQMVSLARHLDSGEEDLLTFRLTFPSGPAAKEWAIRLALVEQNVAWFRDQGAVDLCRTVMATPALSGPAAEAMAISIATNWAFWLPAECILHSRTGRAYPSIMKEANGCRVRDLDGNEWIDMVMAGGSAMLGYAHPRIQEAIAAETHSSAIMTLPHVLELEVSRLLRETIPSAEMVLFGKHGSDACTLAVRLARLHTGRRKILFSGYHGWHDWFADQMQPELRGPGGELEVLRFPLNDLAAFEKLFAAHSQEIAGVMVEPAAQAVSIDGPVQGVDVAFLRSVAQRCRESGAVLIFDEIITGFRYALGGVQGETGVIPDLTCLGKALAAGMPLSALVGRRDVIAPNLSKACYFPTFRGEVYSLAAARKAIEIYRSEDVAGYIGKFGSRLIAEVNRVSEELGVSGEMKGLPIRMIYCFDEADPARRRAMRTLLQQELLQRGVLTFMGFMLPSFAHGESELDLVVTAYQGALRRVRDVAATGRFASALEIPLVG
jgi:glutamate-1-semialdehyde aminotransferase/predicted aldo/keto reductase-like oxidoreductase